jgi:glycosyltransferase involved in cell wall biosynthesis
LPWKKLFNSILDLTMTNNKTTICVGVTVYNGEQYLEQALNRLINQTISDFFIIIVNDGSKDGSAEILSRYEKNDPRISVFTFNERVGMIDAWRKVAHLADKRHHPNYFAWYSDHDYVEKNWLEELLNEFERGDDNLVCVYPKTIKIDIYDNLQDEVDIKYDSSQMKFWERIEESAVGFLGSGDIVYGLFKMSAMRKCGYFRKEIFPDRLLISEIQLFGSIKYTEKTSRYRRMTEYHSKMSDVIRRQKQNLFNPTNIRRHPVISHVSAFIRDTIVGKDYLSNDFIFIKMLHAWLYFTRNTIKFQKIIMEESKNGAEMPKIDAIRDYLLFKKGQNGLVLKRDFASLRKKYQKKLNKYRPDVYL